jgi:Zn-dependent protease
MTGFRHRSYVGWLGLAFVGLAGFVLALARASEAQELGARDPAMEWLVRVLLAVWLGSFLVAAVTAVRETARRLRELRRGHIEAAEALLELARASHEAEQRAQEAEPEGTADKGKASEGEDAGESGGEPS